MFLNEKKLKAALISAKVQMIVGVSFTLFWGFGVVGGILDYGNLRSGLYIYIIFTLPFLWLVWQSIQKRRRVEKARQLNQMFCADADGDIKASQLVQMLGSKNEYQAIKTVGQLIGKGLLRNCTIEQQPYLHVRLYRNIEGGAESVKSIQCPNCGATVEKRVGFTTSCPYCDTKLP